MEPVSLRCFISAAISRPLAIVDRAIVFDDADDLEPVRAISLAAMPPTLPNP